MSHTLSPSPPLFPFWHKKQPSKKEEELSVLEGSWSTIFLAVTFGRVGDEVHLTKEGETHGVQLCAIT